VPAHRLAGDTKHCDEPIGPEIGHNTRRSRQESADCTMRCGKGHPEQPRQGGSRFAAAGQAESPNRASIMLTHSPVLQAKASPAAAAFPRPGRNWGLMARR
jgi:hypothetical protein